MANFGQKSDLNWLCGSLTCSVNIFFEILFWNFYILCKRNCHKMLNWAFTTNQSNGVKQHINKRQSIFDIKCLSQCFWGRQPLFWIFSNNNTGRYFWFSQSVFPRKPSWLKRVKRSWSLSRRRPSSASLEEKSSFSSQFKPLQLLWIWEDLPFCRPAVEPLLYCGWYLRKIVTHEPKKNVQLCN